jgi:hypothetical protein
MGALFWTPSKVFINFSWLTQERERERDKTREMENGAGGRPNSLVAEIKFLRSNNKSPHSDAGERLRGGMGEGERGLN